MPLDHLYDPKISPNGRANLLSVVSIVAPWAYKQNYENIQSMLVYTSQQVDPKLTGTAEIIQNIKARLATQDDNSNKVRPIPAGMNACSQYTPRWGAKYLAYQ